MLDISTIHTINDGSKFLIFHYPSYLLIETNSSVYKIIEQLKNGITISQISKNCNHTTDELNKLLDRLEKLFEENVANNDTELKHEKTLDRITLHVSNDCNLRCKYCYANGGNYNGTRDLMTIDTADNFVDFCKNNLNCVRNIVFFGGEPLMNLDIIDHICEKFKKYSKR